MSSITSHFAGGRPLATGGYSTSLRRFAGRLASAWRHHRDEFELESLPFDLRKDIGYPSADEDAELTREYPDATLMAKCQPLRLPRRGVRQA